MAINPFEALAALARTLFEALLRGPDWIGWALIGLGAAMVALGRQGQRVLMAALCGAAAYWAAQQFHLGTIRGAPVGWIAAGAAAAFGAFLPAWSRAAIFGACGYACGHWLAASLEIETFWVAIPLGALLFLIGFVNDLYFSVVLPPVAAAPALVAGIVRSLPAHIRGAHRPLTDVRVVLIASAVLAAIFVPIALHRVARVRRRKQAKRESGDELKEAAQRAAQKAVFESYAGKDQKP